MAVAVRVKVVNINFPYIGLLSFNERACSEECGPHIWDRELKEWLHRIKNKIRKRNTWYVYVKVGAGTTMLLPQKPNISFLH